MLFVIITAALAGILSGESTQSTRCSKAELHFSGLRKGLENWHDDGHLFQIACEAGYHINDEAEVKCSEGKWKANVPPCAPVDCAEPPTIPYANLEKTATTHGSYAIYAFQDPYKLIGHVRVQCLFGEWIRNPRCNDDNVTDNSTCGPPPNMEEATAPRLDDEEHAVGTEIKYQCNLGYVSRIPGGFKSVCKIHKTTRKAEWTKPEVSCSRIFTPRYPVHACDESSCYPPTSNLLIGREDDLAASSTCGTKAIERYCISYLKDRRKCFQCHSAPNLKDNVKLYHGIENIVSSFRIGKKSTGVRKWWQSENGVENVDIQLDLKEEFHFTHLLITFKTIRPAAMLIERSHDFGRTWKVYQYYAYDCAESFPNIPRGPRHKMNDVVCDSHYSSVEPSTGGEVIFRVLPPNIHIDDPYSADVQNLLKMTNLRINFTKLHTLGDNLLDDSRGEIKEKYYYAIYQMVVRGSCSCHGHASRCVAAPGAVNNPDMVHGQCECTHNTKGSNCEECEDFFNDLEWKPAIGRQTNACKRCNCNGRAIKCHFDRAVFEATGRVSGGVCEDCQYNTMGKNCEHCKPFFYQVASRDIRDPKFCEACDCYRSGSLHGGICDPVTDPVLGLVAGRCLCKKNVDGRRCDRCKNGFWNLQADNPNGCEDITCPMINTENSLIVVYTNNNKVNSRATFRCNGDAKLIGENSAICMPIGQWSNPIPTCESIQRCLLGEISSQLLVEPVKEYYLFGEPVTFSCPRGYELSSEVRRVICLGTSWSDPIPDCVEAIYRGK